MSTNAGGPAFPVQLYHDFSTGKPSFDGYQCGPYEVQAIGLTMRDYFAAIAMQGMFASDAPRFDGSDDQERRANNAYRMADAMLAARGDSHD